MATEVLFTRAGSVAEAIARLIRANSGSLDAALYRFNNSHLGEALEDAVRRGTKLRLVLDSNKFEESKTTRKLLADHHLPFRITYGLLGPGSKMHHKFIILDGSTVLTGSYNWTLESEEENYENLLILRESSQVELYCQEFEALWAKASEV
jgi:cardiolipin hydrolase